MSKYLSKTSPESLRSALRAEQKRLEQREWLIWQILYMYRQEGLDVSFTMEDFDRGFVCEHFATLSLEEQLEAFNRLPSARRRELLQTLPVEERLAGLSPEQIQRYLEQLTASRSAASRKPRRKK